jgi:zinc/manganese transport system substrate-binding protein/manganese/iron transport system substrate-binding protein
VHPKIFIVPALLVAAALTLAGCTPTTPGGGGNAELKVVATTTQVADFTRNVVGDTAGIAVTQLIQPNQSAHSFDPSAAALTALGSADVLVVNGVGLEDWLGDAIDASGFHGVTVSAATGITVLHAATGTESTTGSDPHIWTDPRNAAAMVQTIRKGLDAADPADAAAFDVNAAAYVGKLAKLDDWIRANVESVPSGRRLLVTNHDALGYFTAAYGITHIGSVIPSFDDNAEPSAAEIDALVAKIKATGAKAVFSEASLSPKAAKTIASEAGVTVYSGADALYVDSLGPAGSAGATYIDAQVHNATLILASWGATPTAIPADLR